MKTRKSFLPNGQPEGVFIISIDDGYVEYSYPIKIEHLSIESVHGIICKRFRTKPRKGWHRTSHPVLTEGNRHE